LGACGGGSPKTVSDAPTEAQETTTEEAAPEPTAQVFDSDLGTIEYKGLQDMNPYVYVPFMFTNKTGVTVSVMPANMVVNGQYNVTMLGGSSPLAPIEPGKTGAVTFSLALEQQTGLTSMADIQTISGDFELRDDANINNIVGYIHVDVTV
jgi:hypothetical protein